jgi:hypothetical protein
MCRSGLVRVVVRGPLLVAAPFLGPLPLPGPLSLPPIRDGRRPGIEGVPQPVAEQVERQRRREQEQAGEEHRPPRRVEDLAGVGDLLAPRRRARGHADAQIGQRRLEQDVGRDDERRVDDQRGDEVREDLPVHDPGVGRAHRPRGLDELALAQRQHLAADDAGDVGPAEEPDHVADHQQARLDQPTETPVRVQAARRDEAEREEQHRKGQDDVHRARDDRVRLASVEAGHDAEDHADDDLEAGREDRDDQRGPGAVEDPHEQVLARGVGPEPEVLVRPLRQAVLVEHREEELLVRVVVDEVSGDPAGAQRHRDEHADEDEAAEAAPEDLARAPADDGVVDVPAARRLSGLVPDLLSRDLCQSLLVLSGQP